MDAGEPRLPLFGRAELGDGRRAVDQGLDQRDIGGGATGGLHDQASGDEVEASAAVLLVEGDTE
jgi:hypothetical protein